MSATIELERLPSTAASDIKKYGWKRVVKAVQEAGVQVITNHNEPVAVVLTPAEYARLRTAADTSNAADEDILQTLQKRFEDRLKCLNEPGAEEKFDAVMDPSKPLRAPVIAGQDF